MDASKYSNSNTSNFEWMSELPKELHEIPLTRLAIPGSHNSGAFKFDADSEFSPDAPKNLRDLAALPGLGPMALGVMRRWAVCQAVDFTQQLQAGIRYFDLRIARKKGEEDFYLVHSFYGPKLTCLTEALASFLKDHPREIVILDVNHCYDLEEEHHVQLVTLLLAQFGEVLCARCPINQLNLQTMWDQGKQVILFYNNEVVQDFIEVWPTYCISAPWPNTSEMEKCLHLLSQSFSVEHQSKFMVCQAILTPNVTSILANLGEDLKSRAIKFMPKLCSWISESPSSCVHPLNIIIADFADNGTFIKHVLDLNHSRSSLT